MATNSLDVLGLTPNQSYSIQVFATYTDAAGTTHVSNYSPALTITTPSLSASGSNFQTTNYGTDIQLAGGSLFAGSFPTNLGQIDLTTANPNGTGVVVNQTGVGAYNAGVKQFLLNAKTGSAYFAGTIAATIIESTGYLITDPIDGSTFSTGGMAINLNNGSITSKQFRIDTSGNAYFNGDVSGSIYGGTGLGTYIGSTAQASANGKNVIHYGAIAGTGASSGFGPGGTLYYTSGGTPLFPSTISYGYSNQQVGDTFFSYNSSGNIIAQYTATSGTSWSKTLISSQVISELDVGKLTAGTISAAISMTSATIIGGTIIGGVIETNNGSGQKVQMLNSSNAIQFTNGSGAVVTSISPLLVGGTTYGIIINDGTTPDTTFGNSKANLYVIQGEVRINSGTTDGNGSYITVNSLGASVNGGTSGNVKIGGLATASSTPSSILMQGSLSNVYAATLTIQSTSSGVPSATGTHPGDIWLQY